jgi:hypothetical protein
MLEVKAIRSCFEQIKPRVATFVIPAKAGIQKYKVVRGFWIPD